MTLIVAVKCVDGVVMGADSAATYGALGTPTVRQPTERKIEIIDERVLIGCAGPIGLAQRLRGELEIFLKDKKSRGKPYQVMTDMRRAFASHINDELDAAGRAQRVIGSAAQSSALGFSLVAMVPDGTPTLFTFDQQGAPEEASDQLPFVTIGSGQASADPFIAFLRGIFWEPGKLPTRAEGQFAVVWTLRQCIETTPGGIAEPIHLFELAGDGQKFVARHVEDAELQEHIQAVDDAKEVLRTWRSGGHQAVLPPEPVAGEEV